MKNKNTKIIIKFIFILNIMLLPLSNAFSFDVIAHRAASGYLPEHTMEAVAMAHGFKPEYIEQDVVLTKDNVPIVLHDIYLDSTTDVADKFPNRKRADGRYYAIDFTLAEIKTLNVFERFNVTTKKAVYPNRFPARTGSFKLPTLEEEIIFIKGANKSTKQSIGLYVEIKNPEFHHAENKDLSKIVLDTLSKYGYKTQSDNFYIQTFSFDELKRLRTELNFQGKLIMLIMENSDKDNPSIELTDYSYLMTKNGIAEIAKYANGIGPSIDLIHAGKSRATPLVNYAKDNKLLIHTYTVRLDSLVKGFKDINQLYDFLINVAKVDGFFTDFPDHAMAYKNKK